MKKNAKKSQVGEVQPTVFTAEQVERLDELTAQIKTAQRSFIIIADNVLAIDSAGLWAARQHPERGDRYASLAEYNAVQFQFSGSETSRYVAGGKVLKALRAADVSEGDLPKNESQTRALWRAYKAAAKAARIQAEAANKSKADQKKAAHVAGEKKLVKFWAQARREGDPTTERIDELAGVRLPKRSETLLAGVRARATARNIEGTFIEVSVKATKEQADLLNGLLNAISVDEGEENGVYVLTVAGDSVESVFVRFGAFVTEHMITTGSVSFAVK